MLKFGVGVLVSVLCLLAAVWGIEFDALRSSFARANYATLPGLVILVGLFFWIKAIRWRYLLEPMHRFRTREVAPSLMIGFMGNNILPARLGEFIRVYVLGRQYKLSKLAVLSTVVLERILDIAAILLLFAIGLFLARGVPDSYRSFCKWLAGGTALAFLVLTAYVVWTEPLVRAAESVLNRFRCVPDRRRLHLTPSLELGAQGLASLKSLRLGFRLSVTSIVHWLCNVLAIFLALYSFGIHQRIDSPVLASFIVLGTTAFGVTVPSTPGFFGVIQICFWLSLRIFGVDKADAFAASVYYHMAMYVPVTLTGLFYLNRLGLKLSDVERESEEATAAERSESDAMPSAEATDAPSPAD